MREIRIGDKPMKALTAEDLRRIVMIEGCCPGLEYWNEPSVSVFDNTMFGDCCVIHFSSVRKGDGMVSDEHWFYFQYDCSRFSHTVDPEGKGRGPTRSAGYRPSLATLGYLIAEGFDIPL